MKNNEILQASLLDIVFEHRNKAYGAYALRMDYNKRMMLGLLLGIGFVTAVVLLQGTATGKDDHLPVQKERPELLVRTVELPRDPKPEEPKKAEAPVKKIKTAQIKYPVIKIVPDEKADKPIATIDDLAGKKISTITTAGDPDDGKVKPKEEPVVTNTGNGNEQSETEFKGVEIQPEFPGGEAALQRFLAASLNTPDDLAAGEKKTVRVRFKVEKDGTVGSFEIALSGGEAFDKEVVRVCRRMPRWKPAVQNGVNVPVSYVLPVTFMGVEQ